MKAKIILVIEPETGTLERAQIKKAQSADEEEQALYYLQLYMKPITRFRTDLKRTNRIDTLLTTIK